jgi:hypothetical protein
LALEATGQAVAVDIREAGDGPHQELIGRPKAGVAHVRAKERAHAFLALVGFDVAFPVGAKFGFGQLDEPIQQR